MSLKLRQGYRLQPVFKNSKIENVICSRESELVIVDQQCVVCCFKCGLCEIDYDGYTSRHVYTDLWMNTRTKAPLSLNI